MQIQLTAITPRLWCVCALLFSTAYLFAQNNASEFTHGRATYLGKSSTLKSLSFQSVDNSATKQKHGALKQDLKTIPNFKNHGPFPKVAGSLPLAGDPLVKKQSQLTKSQTGEFQILVDVDGIQASDVNGIAPPDCNGDIGLKYYLMSTNAPNSSLLYIYDKTNGDLVLETSLGPLWAEINRVGVGDPIIYFDRLENRWVLTEFIQENAVLMAVSETEDPMGSYHIYEISTPTFPDYPKFGNWHDAWYLSTNEFQGFNPVYAIDKQAMIAGEEDVTYIAIDGITKIGGTNIIEFASPMNFSGKIAPPATTNFAAFRLVDDDWTPDGDKIEYFEIIPDFETPENTILTDPVDIATSPFELDMCVDGIFSCITLSNGGPLSVIPAIIMNKIQYRNFETYESIVLDFTVDITGNDEAGIRWMELRKQGDENWSTYQEGTFSLNDGTSRFMGSICQDSKGNIIMGYAAAGEEVDPSVGITARTATDELGVMTFGENIIVAGSQPSPGLRWGDYFSMTLDPVDDETFWFTSEYMPANEDWGTRLTAIKLRRDSIDAKADLIASPTTGSGYTNMEEVKIQISNPGFKQIQGVNWGVEFEGNVLESGLHPDVIEPLNSVEITLSNMVDIEAFDTYDFTLYVSLDGDENNGNDTLRSKIRHLANTDMSTSESNNNPTFICNQIIDYEAIFTNKGFETVTSYTANLVLNGMLIQSNDITTNLPLEASEAIVFEDVELTVGNNVISFYASNINGVIDEITSNDTLETNLEYNDELLDMNISFQSDAFSNETSWQILDMAGQVVLEGGGYTGPAAVEDLDFCLPEACYTFILLDSYGDGWGFGGNPFLEIREGDDVVVELDNVNFGSEWTVDFCVPVTCNLEAEVEFQEESAAGAMDGSIIITFPMSNENTMYSIDGGANFSTNPIFENLGAGMYEIVVQYDPNCTYTETIDLLVSTKDISNDPLFVIKPNPHEGLFQLHLEYPEGPSSVKVILMDQQGKIVATHDVQRYNDGYRKTFLMPNLPSGNYYLMITNDAFRGIKKIIKL